MRPGEAIWTADVTRIVTDAVVASAAAVEVGASARRGRWYDMRRANSKQQVISNTSMMVEFYS